MRQYILFILVLMANLKQIKAKIKSVGNLKKITRALEVVSTVKLQKVKHQAEGLKQFLIYVLKILSTLGNKEELFVQDTISSQATRSAMIIITSERGLCGWLNTKLLRQTLQGTDLATTDFFIVGKKGLEFCKRVWATIVGHINVSDKLTQKELLPLFSFFDDAIQKGEYTSVSLAFNYFKNSITQIPTTMQLFPLTLEEIANFFKEIEVNVDMNEKEDEARDILVEPALSEVRQEIRRQIRNYVIMSALVQNKTGEHAARMIAMKNAKDNATGFVKSLTLKFNKERQAAITKEISEIVSAKIAIEG